MGHVFEWCDPDTLPHTLILCILTGTEPAVADFQLPFFCWLNHFPHVHVAVSGDNKPKDVKHALNPVNLWFLMEILTTILSFCRIFCREYLKRLREMFHIITSRTHEEIYCLTGYRSHPEFDSLLYCGTGWWRKFQYPRPARKKLCGVPGTMER